jgi:hypothetical protein
VEFLIQKKKRRVTQKEKERRLEEFNAACELSRIIKKYFPNLVSQLRNVNDPRKAARVNYESEVLLFTRIIGAVFQSASMRKITAELGKQNIRDNISAILGTSETDKSPHCTTINDYLEKLDPKELESIVQKMTMSLLNMKVFKESRMRNRYWQILIDGSQLFTTDEDHSKGSLFRTYKDKDGNITKVEYYYYVVEAKVLLNSNIVISICTVFCENDEDVADPYEEDEAKKQKKQDCERKAFYRMEEELKNLFGNTPVCVTMDSLYACEPVFEICEKNNWRYIIRFKEGSIPTIAKEFNKAVESNLHNFNKFTVVYDIKSGRGKKRVNKKRTKRYEYLTMVCYKGHSLNMVRCTEEGKKYPFIFITNLPITMNNCADLVARGRKRWKVENEGFNVQKNHGYELTHKFSKHHIAIRNHYFLIQIAHAISQIFENYVALFKELKMALYEIHNCVKDDFKSKIITTIDTEIASQAIPNINR